MVTQEKKSWFRRLFVPGKPQILYIIAMAVIYYLVPVAVETYAEHRGLDGLEYHLTVYLMVIPILILIAGAVYGFMAKDFYRQIPWTVICGLLLIVTAEFSVLVTLGYVLVMGLISFVASLIGKTIRR